MAEYDVPFAYGVPIYADDGNNSATYMGTATPLAPPGSSSLTSSSSSRPTLQSATRLNGGRSSRVMLPEVTSSIPEPVPSDVFDTLKEQGFTRGLAEALMKNKVAFPLSFWIVDNSGSMNKQDGHRFLESRNRNTVRLVQCTRWAEMQQTVEYHVQMAALLKHPTVFRMLNDPGRVNGPQQFSICERGEQFIDQDLAIAQSTILNTSPNGVTPLTEHLQEIRANVLDMQNMLQKSGTKVVIVIATDGTPTDSNGYTNETIQKQFVNALNALEGLPVWLVVRLCTDDNSVVEYWNNLDSQLELSLEVLDDFVSEAQEIYSYNKWLNYGLPIHRMREMGFYHRLFDLLDERMLSKDELRDFCRVLFGDGKMDAVPDAQYDWDGFYSSISQIVESETKQWNPITKRMEPWINLKQLKRDYGPGWFSSWW